MVEPGDDDLVTRGPGLGEGAREVVRQLGHAPAEDDALRIRAEKVAHRFAGGDHDLVGPALGGGEAAAIGKRGGHGAGDGLGDHLRGLRAAGTVEVRGPFVQCWELLADGHDIEGTHAVILSRQSSRSPSGVHVRPAVPDAGQKCGKCPRGDAGCQE